MDEVTKTGIEKPYNKNGEKQNCWNNKGQQTQHKKTTRN